MEASVLPEATGAGCDELAASCGKSIGILGGEQGYGSSPKVARLKFRSLFIVLVTAVSDLLLVC